MSLSPVELAAITYLRRRSGLDNPPGYYKGRLWFPFDAEKRACCEQIKHPNSLRQSLLRHCRSAGHVAALYQVEVRELRRVAKALS